VAKALGVGIEVDYEQDSSTYMNALNQFAQVYRSIIPYDSSPNRPAQSVLTIDLGAGTGYLTAVSKLASGWLQNNLANWANAMVAGSPFGSATEAEQYWQQHLDGVGWANIPPMNPQQLVVSLYASSGSKNCKQYDGTVLADVVVWAKQKNVLGIAFWAAGCASSQCIDNCNGIQTGSKNWL